MHALPARTLSRWVPHAVRRPLVLDVAVATGVCVLAQVEVWQGAAQVGSKPVAAIAVLIGGTALVWRRQLPLLTAGVVGVSSAAAVVIAGPLAGLGPLLQLVIAAYSVIAFSRSPAALRAGVSVLLACNAVRDLNDPTLLSPFDYVFSWVMFAAAFASEPWSALCTPGR